jgi:D-3-phosphoglycerate dehydrogenase
MLREEGYTVEAIAKALNEEELCKAIKGVHILGIRSKTKVTVKALEAADKLMAVGAFCIGTNQVNLEACTKAGIAVFNAPFSNTRSVVEMVIGEMIMLMRGTFPKSVGLHQGKWDKSASHSYEIRGKKLGIVGYGNIGSQLSVLAEALGMQVYYYDVEEKLALGNAKKMNSLKDLLRKSDVVTLHVDGRAENKGLIGPREFKMMKDGVIFLNLSRGHVVDIDALRKHIDNGKVRGAAVDVFPKEPGSNSEPFESPLLGLPNVILTPHIGGSTIEAQKNIAVYVPDTLISYINTGNTTTSVNLPPVRVAEMKGAHRLLHIHANVPGILARINSIFSHYNINILGQSLKTTDSIGYLVTDIDKSYDKDVMSELKAIDHTIKLRVLY